RRPPAPPAFPYTTLFRSGLLRLPPRLQDEAVLDVRAFLPQAVLTRGGHPVPDVRVFRHFGQVTSVTGPGALRENGYRSQLCDLGDRKSTRLNSSHVKISY